MLIGLNEILDLADGFAVPAFNTYNMETVMGVIEAAEDCGDRSGSCRKGFSSSLFPFRPWGGGAGSHTCYPVRLHRYYV